MHCYGDVSIFLSKSHEKLQVFIHGAMRSFHCPEIRKNSILNKRYVSCWTWQGLKKVRASYIHCLSFPQDNFDPVCHFPFVPDLYLMAVICVWSFAHSHAFKFLSSLLSRASAYPPLVEQTKPNAQLPFNYRRLCVPLMMTVFNTMAIWMMMMIIMPLLKKKRSNLL